MMFLISQLFVIMTLCRFVQGQCDDDLTVFDENGQHVNTSTVCRTMHTTPDCSPFYQSFNQSDLPEGYPTSSNSVEKPSEIGLEGVYHPYSNGYLYPGLSIRWKPPLSKTGRDNCYGYLIVWIKNTTDIKCRLFHTEAGVNTEFRYNVKVVDARSAYTVRVYSMPPYNLPLKDDDRIFVYKNIMTSFPYKDGNPGDWSPAVVYETFKNGTINVGFSLPPANFNITNFSVFLVKKNQDSAPVFSGQFITEARTEENTQFFLTLNARDSYYYTIKIWADDEYSMIPDKCRCWELIDNQKDCKNTCGGTTTELFYVNITEPPVTTTTTSQTWLITQTALSTSSSPPDHVKDPVDESNPDLLKYILGGLFASIAAVLIVLAFVYFCRKKNQEGKKLIPQWIHHSPAIEKSDLQKALKDTSPPVANKPLTRRTVYLMSAGDHQAHVELVKSFVTFLETHCYCNVIIPSNDYERDTAAFVWFLNSVRVSDYFIFINSEGAQKLIEAHLSETTYTNRVDSDDEFFNWGLRHIMFNTEVREKQVILVSFHGNHCQLYLQVPEICKLPRQLPLLLQKIHGLTAEAIKSYSSSLPLNADNIRELSEGARMLFARKDVEAYEKDNPNWFTNSFGDLKPQYNRLVSDDSGCPLPSEPSDSVSMVISSPDSPTPDHLTDIDMMMCTVENVGTGNMDVTSWVTLSEVHGGTPFLQQQQEQAHEILDGFSLIPPDTESKFLDSFSVAVAQINGNTEEPLYHPLPPFCVDQQAMLVDEDFQKSLIPPADPSELHVDSISSALANFNDNSNCILIKGLAGHLMEQDDDNGYFEQLEFDSVSI